MTFKKLNQYAQMGLYAPLAPGTLFIEVIEYRRNNRSGKTVSEALRDGDYIEWNADKIKAAFAFGQGTQKDFEDFTKANKQYLLMLEV